MSIGTAFTQFLNRNSQTYLSQDKTFPFLNNAILDNRNTRINSSVQTNRKKRLMRWYEQLAGILTGLVNQVATDLNESCYFEPVSGIDKGRNKIKSATDFYTENQVRLLNFALIIDLLITGEAYLYKKGIDKSKLKSLASAYLSTKNLPNSDFFSDMFIKVNLPDTEDRLMRKVINIASETVENIFDKYQVIGYVQRIGSMEEKFSPEDIIHFKLMDINGRSYGFTPLMTLITQLELDHFMWQNMLSLSKNSGQPDKVYSIEDLDINSPAFKRIETNLKKYHQMPNRHGSLLLNGKVKIQDLAQLDSMQFENLGVYIAGLIALQWSIPKSRIPFMSKEADVKEGTGGSSEKSYYDHIEYAQDIIADYWNRGLWTPYFGVQMKHKKLYKQDELRETQTRQMRLDNLSAFESQLMKNKKQLTIDYKIRYFNGIVEEICDEDIEDLDIESIQLFSPVSQRNNQQSNNNLNDNGEQRSLRERRSNEQRSSSNQGNQSTNGYGKSKPELNLDIKTKTKPEPPLEMPPKQSNDLNFESITKEVIEIGKFGKFPYTFD